MVLPAAYTIATYQATVGRMEGGAGLPYHACTLCPCLLCLWWEYLLCLQYLLCLGVSTSSICLLEAMPVPSSCPSFLLPSVTACLPLLPSSASSLVAWRRTASAAGMDGRLRRTACCLSALHVSDDALHLPLPSCLACVITDVPAHTLMLFCPVAFCTLSSSCKQKRVAVQNTFLHFSCY